MGTKLGRALSKEPGAGQGVGQGDWVTKESKETLVNGAGEYWSSILICQFSCAFSTNLERVGCMYRGRDKDDKQIHQS